MGCVMNVLVFGGVNCFSELIVFLFDNLFVICSFKV